MVFLLVHPYVLINSYANLGNSLFWSVSISNLRYSSHTQRVNPYVLFWSTHISNLGHGHMNLLDAHHPLPGDLHLCESNILVESGTTRKLPNSDRKNRSLPMIEKIGHYQWPNQWPKKSITDSVIESVTDSVVESVTDSVTESITDSVIESVTESITESVTDSVTKIGYRIGHRFDKK